jgi:AraC-like DNA-binding protein
MHEARSWTARRTSARRGGVHGSAQPCKNGFPDGDQERALANAACETLARIDRDLQEVSPSVATHLRKIRLHLFDQDWGVCRLRRALPRDYEEIADRFRAELGQSPTRYLAGARIETASRLLRDSGLPVGAVSLLVGYSDIVPFRRAFQRWFGLPPHDFQGLARSVGGGKCGCGEELLSFRFWDLLDRGELDVRRLRRLVGWLQSTYRGPGGQRER